jgi:hypothetical protein
VSDNKPLGEVFTDLVLLTARFWWCPAALLTQPMRRVNDPLHSVCSRDIRSTPQVTAALDLRKPKY